MRPILIAAALVTGLLSAAEVIDENVNWKIRREATGHSAILHTLHMLTDRYGPRLTGSPNHEAAAKWAVAELAEWGLQNAHLEPWNFGHPGWQNERAAGYLVEPVKDNLTFEVLAWTPSTQGAVTAGVVQLIPPVRPSREELTAWLDANRDKVRGKAVLMGKAAVVRVAFNPAIKRIDDGDMRARLDPANPAPMFPSRGGPQNQPGKLTANEAEQMLNAWLAENGAVVRMNDAGREHGQIRAFGNRTFDLTKAVPAVVLRNEDFGRIERLLADRLEVRVQFDIVNQTYPRGETSYNVVAEIPGHGKAGEVVMLGGHLDSWHSATGATDNAIGCATMMEAVRIIRALGLKPRRTIRLALWSGEEQGLLGSKEYVRQHFGTFEEPKPAYGTLAAYFNIDSGTGRARGASVFGPPEAAEVVREVFAPFEDLGVLGAIPSRSRTPGGTDSTSFNAAGLTGIGVMQDPIEYQSHTWHTNLDTYERIIPEDAVKSSIAIAAAVWHMANREEPLPRFSKEKMPEPPKPEGARPEAPKPDAK